MMLVAYASFTVSASGLSPGQPVEASVEWQGESGKNIRTGMDPKKANGQGYVQWVEYLDSLNGGADEKGVMKSWVRAPGSGFDGEPLEPDMVKEVPIP